MSHRRVDGRYGNEWVGNSLVQRRTDEGGKGCKPEELIRRCQGLAEATPVSSWACTLVRDKLSLTV